METWFLNHVLGLSLSVLLVGLPGPLWAQTPSQNSTDPVTSGFYFSTSTDELSDLENNSTSTSSSSESLSASQRNILLTHSARTHAAAANFDTEQTQTFTDISSLSLEPVSQSTEPLTSTLAVATTEASSSSSSSSSRDWRDSTNTDQGLNPSSAVSWEDPLTWMSTDGDRMPQDSPDTTLRQGDASTVHTDSTYTSSTISRAGERTLLSVTSSSSNSTSSFLTEVSNSHQPVSTWGVSAKTEDYPHSDPSTRTDGGDTTEQHMTHTSFSETESPGSPRGIQSFISLNSTQHQHNSTLEDTSDSPPPLKVTEPSTDQSEVSVSSTPPLTSPAEGLFNVSVTGQESSSNVRVSTESSTRAHSSSTLNQEGPDGVSVHTEEHSVSQGLTTAPSTVSSSTSKLDNSLTETPVLITESLRTTAPVTVTERSQITEIDTFKATASTSKTTSPTPPPSTTSSIFISTTSSSTPQSSTEAFVLQTALPTAASTPQPSTANPTQGWSPSHTQGPMTRAENPTEATTLQTESSTDSVGVTSAHSQHIATTSTHSTLTTSTETLQVTRGPTGRGEDVVVPTTTKTSLSTTKAPLLPRNPCVSNPCMNGGMCVSYQRHQYTCHCQLAWTGPECSQDVDECEKDPCPVGSRCVNTRGSFSCECPLGFDLEDGRTCTRAKTFLGTFSVNRQPHGPAVFKTATLHEIQREIIQLLNASLSVLRGYSRSTLSRKGEDGVRITAVNMFSISTEVTSAEVYNSIQMFLSNCSSSLAHCRIVLQHQLTYHAESLCSAQRTQCDTVRSTCTDNSGTAYCKCLPGYYKHNPEDLSCLECGDGYKLENGTCVPCMFGFGGFNCGNFYKLIAVVVSPAGGAVLLILLIALIVTCCKKDKNDINKIIFKSGDMQMSPYADFPKSNRISMEWGRETIEMQENGSTKNLLQMTDIYYSPALRNSDLERNGLYPFTGLPGSRHSCIYPAQWNPSFISDDSRRRDYF